MSCVTEIHGKKSAGVARQYLGRYGKVDNGQVGTFLDYVTRKEHVLVSAKLFIPQEWHDNPARCEKAHISKEVYEKHLTRHEHCLEMLDEQGENSMRKLHFWKAGDICPSCSYSGNEVLNQLVIKDQFSA